MCFVLVDDFLRVALKFSDLHRLTLDVSLQRLYQFPFCLLFLLGHKIREAKQHAGKWLWQYIQWLWDGWFGVRASPRIMACANWQREKSNKQCAVHSTGRFWQQTWLLNFPLQFEQEREAEEQRLAGGGQLHPWAGRSGDGAGSHAAQHRGRHPQNRADHQEHPGAAAGCSGEQTWQVRIYVQDLFFFSFHFLGSILNLQFLFFHHNSVIISCLYLLSFPLLLVIFTLPLHSTSTSIVSASRCPRPSPVWADHVSVKACVGSGTAWDVSALWCPGLRRPPLPFSRSASGPLTPPPGTLASVPASQAQFYFPLPHLCPSVSPANNLALLIWCAAECVLFKKTVSEWMSCIYALTWFWHVGERSWCNTCIQADVNAV